MPKHDWPIEKLVDSKPISGGVVLVKGCAGLAQREGDTQLHDHVSSQGSR